jgi:ADP-ribose pyrophosphatase
MRLREEVIRRRVVYRGGYLSAERWDVRLPDGRRARRDIVRPPDAVAVVPVDARGRVHLVRQFRPALGRAIVEIPAGILDAGETPARAARRECAEELGLAPRRLRRLCTFYSAVGFSTGCIHLFLAEGLRPATGHADPTEFLATEAVSFPRALHLALTNRFVDAKTLLGLLWAARWLGTRTSEARRGRERGRERARRRR